MSEEHLINSVNKHYLDKVMSLAEERDIKATEDIFDSRGMKLVAKGARISRTLQERLIMRRLSKPFESSITVESGVDLNVISTEAERIVETVEPVRAIVNSIQGGPRPLDVLAGIRFGSAMSTMLTIIERGGEAALAHSVMVSVVSICLAQKFKMNAADQNAVALAGLLHDIGELYIEPEYLNSGRRLYPHEWRHVVVHPRIGQMLIQGLEDYPPAVAQAVFEHHERFDGAGYPRQVTANGISAAGQVISVAEMISGVFVRKDKPLQRAELALKIVPGEHARELVSAVSVAMRQAQDGNGETALQSSSATGEEGASVQSLFDRLLTVQQTAEQLQAQSGVKSKRGSHLLSEVVRRAAVIQRAFSSTGLDACLQQGSQFFNTRNVEILFETAVATREIQWRLRDVARDLALQASGLDEQEMQALEPLISLLDGAD